MKETPTIQKTKLFFTPVILGILFVLIYYSYEYVEKDSKPFLISKSIYQKDIDNVSSALNIIKKEAENTSAFKKYEKLKAIKEKSKVNFYRVKKEERIFNFKALKNFLYEFGPNLTWFSFMIYILFRSFYFERKNIGIKFLYGVMISLTLFKFYWIFQQFQDVNKVAYYLMTFISGLFIVIAVSLITKYQDHIINRLKKQKFKISKFAFLNTKDEKRDEMLKTLKEVNSSI